MTIVEILVAAGLGILLLGLGILMLSSMFRGAGRGSARVELQEEAVVASNRLIADLAQCTAAGVGLYNGPDGAVVSLQRLTDVTADVPPVQVYDSQLHVYYYQPSERRLYRRNWPPQPPALGITISSTRPVRPTQAQLQQLLAGGPSSSGLAQDVMEFSVTSAVAAPSVSPPLTIHLVMQRQAGNSTPEKFELTRTVSLRNAE